MKKWGCGVCAFVMVLGLALAGCRMASVNSLDNEYGGSSSGSSGGSTGGYSGGGGGGGYTGGGSSGAPGSGSGSSDNNGGSGSSGGGGGYYGGGGGNNGGGGNQVNAITPVIPQWSPDAYAYFANAGATTVTVTLSNDTDISDQQSTHNPGGTTYQWYKNTANNNTDGTPIDLATSDNYTPPTDSTGTGTFYYYVVVTNTINDNGDGGTKTATAASGTVKVIVPGIKVNYADGTSEVVVYASDTSKIPFTRRDNTLITSVVVSGVTDPYLVGRKADTSDLKMKFNASGSLQFRTAEGGFIPIGSYAEFQLINTDGGTRSGSYKQEADLDLMNEAWTPVGSDDLNQFTGTFDGGDKKIHKLTINSTENYQGLFGRCDGGTIRNVHIASDSTIETTGYFAGAICGYVLQASIENCSNAAQVTGSDYAGGITGYNGNWATTKNCYNTGTVSGTESVGGVVGYNEYNGRVIASKNSGRVSGTNYIGGVVGGSNSNYLNAPYIIASYNTGAVSGTNYIGGVVGTVYYTSVSACYSIGTVTGTTNVGGVVGYQSNSSIQGCYYSQGGPGAGGTEFSGTAWPSTGDHAQWGTGSGTGDNTYWDSLGGWNSGDPIYPKLHWEE